MIDDFCVNRENSLYPLAEAHLPNRDALSQPGIVASDYRAFERLQTFLIAFLDFDVDPDGVSGPKLREVGGALILLYIFGQQGVLHDNFLNPLSYRSLRPESDRVEDARF